MKTSHCRGCMVLVAGLLLFGLLPGIAVAQEPQSAALARELVGLLEQQKITCIATRDATQQDLYYAALYPFQGELLVVGAAYKEPVLLNPKLARKEYMEVYTDLNSACVPGTKVFVMDLGADGLKAKADGNAYDSYEQDAKKADKVVTTRLTFDGDWKKQGLNSEDDYTKAFGDADARYAKMLRALIAQAKKTP
jgi:hypothetical protein